MDHFKDYIRETDALREIYDITIKLKRWQIEGIYCWIKEKFRQEKNAVQSNSKSTVKASKTVKRKSGRPRSGVQPIETEITGFSKYRNFIELYAMANCKTKTDKLLLAAAYLQEREKCNGFRNKDINRLLLEIGEAYHNLPAMITSLIQRRPPWFVKKPIQGKGKFADRVYTMTEVGLLAARELVAESAKISNC